tara:strand:+ start:1660 stop:2010 length:351 start_codon:yes stop_codon:yes gene_type:complete
MALITSQNISETGIIPTLTAAAASATFENSGSEFLMIHNDSGLSTVVECVTQVTSIDLARYGEVTKANASLTLATQTIGYIGPFPPASYNDEDGIATVTVSVTDNIRVAVLTIGNN